MMPSRKWLVARIVGLAAIATAWVTTGTWDAEESVALIGLLTEAVTSWLIPNETESPA